MDILTAIQERRSVRSFIKKAIPTKEMDEIKEYAETRSLRLTDNETDILFLEGGSGAALEGAAGYQNNLVNAPCYMVVLTAPGEFAIENAAYLAEDVVLKLTMMELSTCWITFADSDEVKKALSIDSDKNAAAIIAFGYGEKLRKKLRINIKTMSDINISAKRAYFNPKKSVGDLVFNEEWGNRKDVDEMIGFYGDILWDSFNASSQTPSYLNRQPFGFLLHGNSIYLVKVPDEYTDETSHSQDLGIVMLHFAAAAKEYLHTFEWELHPQDAPAVPAGYEIVAKGVI